MTGPISYEERQPVSGSAADGARWSLVPPLRSYMFVAVEVAV
jgi:hypothetical protein